MIVREAPAVRGQEMCCDFAVDIPSAGRIRINSSCRSIRESRCRSTRAGGRRRDLLRRVLFRARRQQCKQERRAQDWDSSGANCFGEAMFHKLRLVFDFRAARWACRRYFATVSKSWLATGFTVALCFSTAALISAITSAWAAPHSKDSPGSASRSKSSGGSCGSGLGWP